MNTFLRTVVSAIMLVSLSTYTPVYGAAPIDGEPSLEIRHTPTTKVKAGKIIELNATFDDREGIELVRIYFRAQNSTPYFFVPMIVAKGSEYYGVLPAPTNEPDEIEYMFLVKTFNSRLFTSQGFTAKVLENKNAKPSDDLIDVLVETSTAPTEITGFNPRTKIRLVTQEEKHGVLAGLYDPDDTKGTASNGHYHGTIVAEKKSNSNMLLIAGGVAAGAAAVALIAGSSSSSSSSSEPTPVTPGEESTGVGQWNLEYTSTPCSKNTTQVVECSDEGLVTDVSPTAIGIPVPDACDNSPYNGLSDVFIIGGTCDTVTACNNYSSSDLVEKTCGDSSMVFIKEGGVREERWTVNAE